MPCIPGEKVVVWGADFPALVEALKDNGRQLLGPTLRDGAIVYDAIRSVEDLPTGWTARQQGGRVRLERREDEACFGYTPGFESWKKVFHPPRQVLWEAQKKGRSFSIKAAEDKAVPLALLGVRACELHALAILDRVFLGRSPLQPDGPVGTAKRSYISPSYATRREDVLVVAVQCSQAGETCFCASMGTGPQVTFGFDLCLTELADHPAHPFLVEVGTEAGARLLERVPSEAPPTVLLQKVQSRLLQTERSMGRSIETASLPAVLSRSVEGPHWERVGQRCLACGNCTMVCPTCFCSTLHEEADWSGGFAERASVWDSCFNLDFSYVYGGSIRSSASSRYRQWLMHKFAWWHEQFGSSGCVGCGRCINWCPVGLDVTEEIRTLRDGLPTPGRT